MTDTQRQDGTDTVTVHSFFAFDLDSCEMRPVNGKATRDTIGALRHARLVPGTAEDVPRDALDGDGLFRRQATGWGDLS